MRKITILFALLLFAGMQVVFSQVTITGTVTLDEDGSTLPGVTVLAKGTTTGTVTDIDGKYQLEVPETATTLTFSYIGLKTIDVEIGSQKVINVSMKSDFFGLDEVIVSGVASGTQKKKMTVTVGRLGAEQLEQVPATSAASALQGKMAGVQVINNTGAPGQAATILLRGSTSLMGSQEPMYIVDGAIIEGTLADINANDIENIEVVKGASASALYGSRAGNGVIVITTKRGKNLKLNQTKVTIRNEFGANQLPKTLDLSTHHHYELKNPDNPGNLYTDFAGVTFPEGYAGGTDPTIAGGLIQSTDLYQDNEYAFINDHQDRIFKNGNFYTNFISVANRKEKTNFYISFENSEEEGIIELTEGFNRKNFRVNIDHYLSDKIKISASNSIGKSYTNSPGGALLYTGGIFFDVLFLWPDVDLDRHNEQDGSEYDVDAGFWNTNEDNPLYALSQRTRVENRTSMIGTYSGQWYAADWLTIDAKYAFDRRHTNYTAYTPKGFLTRGGGGLVEDLGQLQINNSSLFFQTAQVTANFNYQFNKLITKAKISYLYEDMHSESSNTTGYDFSIAGIPSLNAIIGNKSISSSETDIISDNIFGIFQFDYDGKYLADVMYRYDGSSLFGENERWQPYYRVSAAYRLTEDITIPGIQEFKLRAAYGISGQRPGFYAQYETYNFCRDAWFRKDKHYQARHRRIKRRF